MPAAGRGGPVPQPTSARSRSPLPFMLPTTRVVPATRQRISSAARTAGFGWLTGSKA